MTITHAQFNKLVRVWKSALPVMQEGWDATDGFNGSERLMLDHLSGLLGVPTIPRSHRRPGLPFIYNIPVLFGTTREFGKLDTRDDRCVLKNPLGLARWLRSHKFPSHARALTVAHAMLSLERM